MQKSKRKGQKSQGRAATAAKSSTSRPSEKKVTAVVATSVVKRVGSSVAFGRADAHEDYPEGGLRLTVRFRPTTDNVGVYTTKTLVEGGFQGAFGNHAFMTVSLDTTGTIPSSSYNNCVFPVGLRAIATYFQRFRVRSLTAEYVSTSSTAVAARISLGYVRDPVYGMRMTTSSQGVFYTSQAFVDDLPESVSSPCWQGFQVPMIRPTKSSAGDKLFTVNQLSATYGTSDSEFLLANSCQGLVACWNNTVQTSATALEYGQVFYDAVIDLYGLDIADASPTLLLSASSLGRSLRPMGAVRSETKERVIPDENKKVSSQDVELDAVLVKSQSQPALRTEGRQVGQQDERRSWFGKPA
jgi:hypothetical protein